MVIESFVNPKKAERRPWNLFFIGFLYAAAAGLLSLWIFRQYSSLVMVTLTVVASLPLMYRTLKHEEKVDTMLEKESKILIHHSRTLSFLLFMFIGFLVAFSLLYILLPAELVQLLFKSQMETITSINNKVSGNVSGDAITEIFSAIFLNNVRVLMFCIFFAFFYGAGTIFILSWNATVIGAAMGNFMKNIIAEYAAKFGSLNVFNYFHVFSLGLFRYSIHGIPEVAAYFIGGIAGGIISVAMINHDLETDKFKNIMLDALDLVMLAVLILFIAAILEVFVTPAIFS
ncbi:stage II sporulation protein M [Candidatus Woesearchaeota archaeon]|nr:stage II sporulation protein M [Candidatus Woesearchaeota archaeon]